MKWFSQRKRPMHVGKYPMHKIKRVDQPTTYISNDVKRVPKRVNMFTRAAKGDLGKKAQFERPHRFAKTPLSAALRSMSATHDDIHDGPVAPDIAPITTDTKEVAEHIKAMCMFLDADMVGICEIPDYAWYSHDNDGTPIEPYHKYAIVIVTDQGFETLDAASGDDWISNVQSQRAYLMGSTIACTVADYIRQLGYPARAHTATKSDVLHLPLTLLSGMGELSRIGELVLNPFLGPRFKTHIVTTDLAMQIDKPIDFGLQDFCSKCMKCANNQKGASCGRCMKMCPFNKEGLFTHRLALWLAIKVPPLRGLLARMDDWFEYGKRTVANKWWWNHENLDGEYVIAKAENERDLKKEFTPRSEDRYAVFPPDTMPPPDHDGPFPIDRPAGVKRRAESEKPPK